MKSKRLMIIALFMPLSFLLAACELIKHPRAKIAGKVLIASETGTDRVLSKQEVHLCGASTKIALEYPLGTKNLPYSAVLNAINSVDKQISKEGIRTVKTDESGVFEIVDLEPGFYYLYSRVKTDAYCAFWILHVLAGPGKVNSVELDSANLTAFARSSNVD